jgi:CHRD domain
MFLVVSIITVIVAGVALAVTERFAARLTGAQEVPPVSTTAEGTARFAKVSNTRMTYRLTASNIDNVSAAHIHLAPRGKDGPIVVSLRVPATCTVEGTSISCQGAFTSAQFEGPFEGRSLNTLARAMRDGRTYVNVHTTDFPDGEIRGQIRSLGTY